jgi:hypothetical protein
VVLTFLVSSALVRAFQEFNFTDFQSGTTISATDMNNKINLLNKRLAAVGTVTSIGMTTSINFSGYVSSVPISFSTVFYDYAGGLGHAYVSSGSFLTFNSLTEGAYEVLIMGALNEGLGSAAIEVRKNSIPAVSLSLTSTSVSIKDARSYFQNGDSMSIQFTNQSASSVSINPAKTKLVIKKL